MRDYCPSKKEQEKLKIKKSNKASKKSKKRGEENTHKSLWISFLSVFVVLVVGVLLFFAFKKEFSQLYQLKTNRSVLLIKDDLPRAFLFFDVSNEELIVIDLNDFDSSLDFDREKFSQAILEEASFSSEVEKRIFYSFLLDNVIDDHLDYQSPSLGREELTESLKNKKYYYYFLKNPDVSWKYLDFSSDNITNISEQLRQEESFFNCPVAIVNTTDQPGLANKLASLLEKASFLIIKKDSNSSNLEESYFVYDPQLDECAVLLDKLKEIMPETKVKEDHQAAQAERAGLVIYIGQDLADLYFLFVNLFHGHF